MLTPPPARRIVPEVKCLVLSSIIGVFVSLLLNASPTAASPAYPLVVSKVSRGELDCIQCIVCHETSDGGKGTATQPLGAWLFGRSVFSEDALEDSLFFAGALGLDSDEDGYEDIDELEKGWNPNIANDKIEARMCATADPSFGNIPDEPGPVATGDSDGGTDGPQPPAGGTVPTAQAPDGVDSTPSAAPSEIFVEGGCSISATSSRRGPSAVFSGLGLLALAFVRRATRR